MCKPRLTTFVPFGSTETKAFLDCRFLICNQTLVATRGRVVRPTLETKQLNRVRVRWQGLKKGSSCFRLGFLPFCYTFQNTLATGPQANRKYVTNANSGQNSGCKVALYQYRMHL